MGLTLTRFSECYRALTEEKYESVFDKVKMTCIVCNYSRNKRLAKKICHNEELYRRTGENMLYIAFDEGTESEWGCYGYSVGSCDDQRRRCMTNEDTFDNDVVIGIISEYVDYSGDDPFIIISTNVRDREILVMHTSTKLIEKQLVELGRYCTESDNVTLNDPMIAEISEVFPVTLPQSLLEVLTNVTVLNERANCNSKHFLNDICSRKYVTETLKKLKSMFSTAKEKLNLFSKFERALKLAELYNRHKEFFRDYINGKYHNHFGIERFGRFLNDLNGNVNVNYKYYYYDLCLVDFVSREYKEERGFEEKSFGRPTEDLYKIVQETLNYTATQYIRKCLGIPMPEYFFQWCKHCTGNECIETGRETVWFNQKDGCSNWKGPELGKLRCAFEVIGARHMFQTEIERYPIITSDKMLCSLNVINRARNPTSHNGGIIEENRFIEVYNSFNHFTDFVPMLLEMKNSLFDNR